MKKSPSVNGHFFSKAFGQISWISPPWLTYLKQTAKQKPGFFWSAFVAIIFILTAAVYGVIWYKHLPQPQWVTAVITAPKISQLTETKIIPDSLTIDFGRNNQGFTPVSVAAIEAVSKPVIAGIEMRPALAGNWHWDSDSRLIFTPNTDWPADQRFDLKFSKTLFTKNAPVNPLSYSFSTAPFTLKISDFIFYQDPLDPTQKKAVATVDFNFPVDVDSFEKHLSFILQALKKGKLDLSAQKYAFKVNYDPFKRKAFIHSENMSLPEHPRFLDLAIEKGVQSLTGSGQSKIRVSQNLYIPDANSYFKLTQTNAAIIRNDKDQPEQILNIETSLGTKETEINKAIHLYLLPKNYPATAYKSLQKDYQWTNPGEVTSAILAAAKPVKLEPIPAARNYATLHSYRFKAEKPGFLYLKIDKGLKGFGNYSLNLDYKAIVKIPEVPKEIRFLHQGSLLALANEKKISVTTRGLETVQFNISRVIPDNLNQLITQTAGDFNNPYFINQQFNQQNISQIFSEMQSFNTEDLTKQQYTSLDLSKYLGNATNQNGPRGLFLLEATGWDKEKNTALDVKTKRLILITDLGLLVKDNADKSHDVFLQSITTGQPLAFVKIDVLGKNGLSLLTAITDNQGHASIPDLSAYREEKEPIAFLATLGEDVSFIPYANFNRQLNYSRFETGGLYTADLGLNQLSAYIFSDRGIYRPGDKANLAMIIKQSYAKMPPLGLPLQVTVVDPRGTIVEEKALTIPETGLQSFAFQTSQNALTGLYTVNLSLMKDKAVQGLLGSATFKVAEFLPDRLRIKASFSKPLTAGWIAPTGLTASVDLMNLYGTKALNHKVSAKILLNPKPIHFDKFKDFTFVDPYLDPTKTSKVLSENLPDVKTNEEGKALFPLDLGQYEKSTYELHFYAEGFEAEGGRSVSTEIVALVSPLDYFVGFKQDGDFNYIKQQAVRSIDFIAVNKDLEIVAIQDLKIQIAALEPISTLIKNTNGTYQYQSVIKSKVISTKPFGIAAKGSTENLPTQEIGDFSMTVLDKNNRVIASTKFTVVGTSQKPLAKNAELTAKLNQSEYKPDEDIEIQITAPYSGAGLITLERDKVYAIQWFQTSTTSSLQKIHIPKDFQGDGYVNVAFIRNWDSPEIFINPLSYTVLPFTLSHETSSLKIDLDVPEKAKPGDVLTINYKTDKPAKIILFGVDEGILQVSRYKTPDPLGFFFQKHALEVTTQQTVDQILPKYILARELSAAGGDGGEEGSGALLNPFKRKTDLPVVFWSGIVEAGTDNKAYTYQIPEYFNGTLRIMAVAVSDNELGSVDKKTLIQGDFIITPNVPTFIAPGDTFEITAAIANNLKVATEGAIQVSLDLPDSLESLSAKEQQLTIPVGEEKTLSFKLRAKSLLGSATIGFHVAQKDKASQLETSLSLRAASPLITTLKTAKTTAYSTKIPLDRDLYPNYREVNLSLSESPLLLVLGLQVYLDNFPYGCTEQLISKAFPLLVMAKKPWFAEDSQKIQQRFAEALRMLSERQMSSGAFAYWPGVNMPASEDFATVYAMHFLTEAKSQGYPLPANLYYYGLEYLKQIAAQNNTELGKARVQAYAIYVLTRNEIVTTDYLTNLQLHLDMDGKNHWEADITGAFLAASYQLLQNQEEADRLMALVKIPAKHPDQNTNYSDFYSPDLASAEYLYLLAKHFPQQLAVVGDPLLSNLVDLMNTHDLNSLLSSFISLAISTYPEATNANTLHLSLLEQVASHAQMTPEKITGNYALLPISESVSSLNLTNTDKKAYYYQLSQTGFDKGLPKTALSKGLEIYRDYRTLSGVSIQTTTLGSEIEVHLKIRALDNRYLSNIAIVDLLPGGFELVSNSIKTDNIDFADAREDRIIFYTTVAPNTTEIVYKIKATNIGIYTIPPPFAESMYKKDLMAEGISGLFTVTE